MREIKFRAWDTAYNFMRYPGYSDEYISLLDGKSYEVNEHGECELPYKLMQFTGLHDTNKKEVYEGDILKFTDVDFAYVSFYEGKYLTNAIYEGRFTARSDFENLDLDYALRIGKVIGNIYEHNHLLEGEVNAKGD